VFVTAKWIDGGDTEVVWITMLAAACTLFTRWQQHAALMSLLHRQQLKVLLVLLVLLAYVRTWLKQQHSNLAVQLTIYTVQGPY
jgi:hypothetical protein